MPAQAHTPTPWAADPDDREGYEWNIHIVTESNRDMRVAFMTSGPEAEGNAHFIVKAVNAHDDLVSVLTELMEVLRKEAPGTALNNHRFDGLGIRAYAALAKAGAP